MALVAKWGTRIKWLFISGLIVWSALFAATAYSQCRLQGTSNLACGVRAVITGYFSVLYNVIVAVLSFFSWVLP
jgi:hypothetical protein